MGTAFARDIRTASSRPHSEDRAEAIEHDDALVVVVADGAGGVTGGATASEAVARAVRARVAERPFDPYNVRAWSDVLSSTDADLARASAGETTAVVAVVGPHGVVGVSVGDSEAWMVSRRADRLTDRQDRARLGTGHCKPAPFHRRSLEGVLVVATDGLFRHAASGSIASACTSGTVTEIANTLVGLPKLRSGAYPDDVAIVVVGAACSTKDQREGLPIRRSFGGLAGFGSRAPPSTTATGGSGRWMGRA